MDYFEYKQNELWVESVPLSEIAKQYGTPTYVYSKATFERHWRAFDDALGEHPHTICFAVKSNSNIGILQVLAKLGAGFDVVSVGELERVLVAGGDPQKVVFSGVGKLAQEIQRGLEVGIGCFNVESVAELQLINELAGALGVVAPVSLRINPNVDAKTHPYIATGLHESKFGIDSQTALNLYLKHAEFKHVNMIGIDCHIGSQITELSPFLEAVDHIMEMAAKLKAAGLKISHLDLGGGLGVTYHREQPPHPYDLAASLRQHISNEYHIILEPGRAIAANAGILLSRVLQIKDRDNKLFAIVDAGMNDLLRPALYEAWHDILPVKQADKSEKRIMDIVGPVCESGDFFGKSRSIALQAGDLLAVRSAGAYGFVMSSQYNSRPRAAEILVDGTTVHEIRRRETIADLYAHEKLID